MRLEPPCSVIPGSASGRLLQIAVTGGLEESAYGESCIWSFPMIAIISGSHCYRPKTANCHSLSWHQAGKTCTSYCQCLYNVFSTSNTVLSSKVTSPNLHGKQKPSFSRKPGRVFLQQIFLTSLDQPASSKANKQCSTHNFEVSLSGTNARGDVEQEVMKKGSLESILLFVIASWVVSSLLVQCGHGNGTFLWPESIAVLSVGGAALAADGLRYSQSLSLFHPRSGASPGVPLGVVTLPLLYTARLVQEQRVAGQLSGEFTRLTLWAVLASGAGMVAAVIATWHAVHHCQHSHQVPASSQTHQNGKSNGDDNKRIGDVYRNGNQNGHIERRSGEPDWAQSESGFFFEARDGEKGQKQTTEGGSVTWRFLAGWGIGSLAAVAIAICTSDWSGLGSATVAGWIATHSMTCGALLLFILKTFPHTTTPGEALLVAEGLTLYCLDALFRTIAKVAPWVPMPPQCYRHLAGTGDEIDAVVQSMVVGVLLLPFLWGTLLRFIGFFNGEMSRASARRQALGWQQVATFYLVLAGVVMWLVPSWLDHITGLGKHPFSWAVDHILEHAEARIALCCYWLLVMLLPLKRLRTMATEKKVAHILVRKYYHLMAVAMFVPALALQAGFLRLAFGVALAAFLLLEVLRVAQIPPFGKEIDAFMQAFIDSRDSGVLIISHFSLLLGCALPLWVSSGTSDRGLAPFAGILSLGVGDTMASVVGYQYGRIRITKDSKKTVEGTVAGIASMVVACGLLAPFIPNAPFSLAQWVGVATATAAAGLLEAYTTQLDNAFVPLVYYALLVL